MGNFRYPNEAPIITCEGETEVWYFNHLKKLINTTSACKLKLTYKPEVEIEPLKKAKSFRFLYKRSWYHILDKETCRQSDIKVFNIRISDFKKIKKINKNAELALGYSNVSFELWLLMHKSNKTPVVHSAKGYWKDIKKVYKLDDIDTFDDYKSEKVFERVLKQITLNDVKAAIRRADKLQRDNANINRHTNELNHYEDNPSTSVHDVVKAIFESAGITY